MKKTGFNFKLDKRQIECPDDAMWDSAWQQLNAVLRSLHPDWNNDAINKEIIRRLSHHESL